MEPINKLMEKQATELKTIQPTNFIKKFQALNDEENSIIEKKYSLPRITKLSHSEIVAGAAKLLLKIKVITGWVLPSGELMAALLDVFVKKIIEDYPNLNFNEIEFAFIKYGTVIEDWGKEVNLNLIDKVLIPYVDKRFELSVIEEKIKNQNMPVQKIYTEEQMLNERREEIELAFRAMKKGRLIPIHLIPGYWKQVLVDDELMQEEETLGEFFSRRLATSEQIYTYE